MTDEAAECGVDPRTEMFEDDRALAWSARHDTEAAGRLYDRHYREVFGYVYHCTLDPSLTEDLTSNVFLAAFSHLGQYRWQRIPLRAWLYRIATNEVRMHYRRRKRFKSVRLRPEHEAFAAPAPASGEAPAAAEEYRLVHKALLQLRPKYRTVIILRYFEDRTIAEIAAITGKREGTIKSQLHRGLAQLQEILVCWDVLPS